MEISDTRWGGWLTGSYSTSSITLSKLFDLCEPVLSFEMGAPEVSPSWSCCWPWMTTDRRVWGNAGFLPSLPLSGKQRCPPPPVEAKFKGGRRLSHPFPYILTQPHPRPHRLLSTCRKWATCFQNVIPGPPVWAAELIRIYHPSQREREKEPCVQGPFQVWRTKRGFLCCFLGNLLKCVTDTPWWLWVTGSWSPPAAKLRASTPTEGNHRPQHWWVWDSQKYVWHIWFLSNRKQKCWKGHCCPFEGSLALQSPVFFPLIDCLLHAGPYLRTSLVAHLVKNPPAMQETQVQFLGWEDPLEEGMAIHSSILAWRIP